MNTYTDINALNNTGMKYLQQSPAHYRAWRAGLLDAESTPAQLFGAAVHCRILEPDDFHRRYARFEGDRRTKAGKAAWAEIQLSGKAAFNARDWEAIQAIYDAVMLHPAAAHLVENSHHEIARTWTDDDTGAACKGIADMLDMATWTLTDLKTTLDAGPDGFKTALARYQYHRQGAFYLDGFKAAAFNIIAVEKAPPYAVAVYRLPPYVLNFGRDIYKPLAALYQDCIESDRWPAYDSGVNDMHLPAWAIPDELAA